MKTRGAVLGAALSLALGVFGVGPAAHAATLYGLIDTGELFSSADNGVNWAPVSTLPVRDAVALAARLSTSDLFLASRSGSIYRSTNAGLDWNGVGTIPASDVEDLLIRPDGALLVLTATGSLYRSIDLGATFSGLAALTASNFVSLTATAPAVRYYALTLTGEVYESVDAGATWVPKGTMTVSNAQRIRAVQSTLYVLTETGDVFRSTDAGANWTAIGTLSQVGMRGLVRNGSNLAAATKEGHVASSADGATWSWQGSINQLELTALASNEPATTGVEPPLVAGLHVGVPFPNPSSGAMSFALRLERDASVEMALHDLGGRVVARRAPQRYAEGSQVVVWSPQGLKAGLYFLRVSTSVGSTATRHWVVTP